MSIEEVTAVVLSEMEELDTGAYYLTYQKGKKWLPDLAPELSSIFFQFDHKGRLYRLQIEIDAPKDPLTAIGYEAAYKKVCDAITDKAERGGVNCYFLDDNLYNEAIEYYKNERLKDL